MKKVPMKFSVDGFVDGVCLFPKDQIHMIDEASVARWERRGAKVVELPVEPEKVAVDEKPVLEEPKSHKRGRPKAHSKLDFDGDHSI